MRISDSVNKSKISFTSSAADEFGSRASAINGVYTTPQKPKNTMQFTQVPDESILLTRTQDKVLASDTENPIANSKD